MHKQTQVIVTMHTSKLKIRTKKSKYIQVQNLKRKVKIQELTDLQRLHFGARAMLHSTVTPDRATPILLLKHQSLYQCRTYYRVCVLQCHA
jgi:hypothetical protein